jgi:uncharacterized protein (DUF2147 family)
MTITRPIESRTLFLSYLLALGVLAVLVFPSVLSAAPGSNAITGTWLTSKADSKVLVYPCGNGEFCGRLTWIKDSVDREGRPYRDTENPLAPLRSRFVNGLTILNGLKSNSLGKWDAGTIYDPESGKTYRCKAELEGKGKLKFRGYVGISLLGKTEIWTRVE